jgi:hypothetical protein
MRLKDVIPVQIACSLFWYMVPSLQGLPGASCDRQRTHTQAPLVEHA